MLKSVFDTLSIISFIRETNIFRPQSESAIRFSFSFELSTSFISQCRAPLRRFVVYRWFWIRETHRYRFPRNGSKKSLHCFIVVVYFDKKKNFVKTAPTWTVQTLFRPHLLYGNYTGTIMLLKSYWTSFEIYTVTLIISSTVNAFKAVR